MSKHTGKLCSCGFPQSYPIPHEHDQTVREQIIVKHFEGHIRDLLKQREDLLMRVRKRLIVQPEHLLPKKKLYHAAIQ